MWRRRMWLLFAVPVALYAAVLLVLYLIQRNLLYFPDKAPLDAAATGVAGLRTVQIRAADGLALTAWQLPPRVPDGMVILYLHGNGGSIAGRVNRIRWAAAHGLGGVFLEYRGYGGNPGTPSETGLLADARGAFAYLARSGVAEDRIILYGESLGTGVAVRMAAEHRVAALILESPYASILGLAEAQFPWVPVRLLLRDRFESIATIGAVRAPTLVLQGGRDEVVPPASGQALFARANEPKELWVAPQGAHNDLANWGALEAAFRFLARHLGARVG